MPPLKTTEEAYEEALRTTTVQDCLDRNWSVILQCTACREASALPMDRLTALPARLTMASLAKAARCGCGNLGAWIDHRAAQAGPLGAGLTETTPLVGAPRKPQRLR